MVAVQHKWYRLVWNIVPMGTYMYKDKKMIPGFTMSKEQTTVFGQMSMLKKNYTQGKFSFTC
jgi:hypothetical protein